MRGITDLTSRIGHLSMCLGRQLLPESLLGRLLEVVEILMAALTTFAYVLPRKWTL